MPMSPTEAAQTLKAIENTQGRSASAYGYSMAAPHLILWGAIWVIGYGVPWLLPGRLPWIWLPLVVIGMVGSFAIGMTLRPKAADKSDPRFWQTFVAIFLFVWAQFAVLPKFDLLQAAVYFPILVALMYALMGIWTRGARMTVLVAAIGVLTLVGYFLLPQLLLPWMTIVGGGGLIVGGLWLRKA